MIDINNQIVNTKGCQYSIEGSGKLYSADFVMQAIKEKEERENGCLSCTGDEWYFNRWCWIDDKGDTCHLKINFCPMCGRKLGDT